jgi:hypothetical protein
MRISELFWTDWQAGWTGRAFQPSCARTMTRFTYAEAAGFKR